jgi:23S rRNA pseudouridine1911/1915/1917 synthase
LLEFLARHLNLSRKKAKSLLDQRAVKVNGRPVWMARHTLKANDEVSIRATASATELGRKAILWEDDHLLAVNKPAGLLSTGSHSLETLLRTLTRTPSVEAVHRLDRDTTGVILFARNRQAKEAMVRLFREKAVSKVYHALVRGRLAKDATSIRKAIQGQSALTRLTVLDATRSATHVRLLLATGRTHQARKHLAFIRHPVLGDTLYGGRGMVEESGVRVARQMLHARRVTFEHPLTGERVQVEAPLPDDFRRCMRELRLK